MFKRLGTLLRGFFGLFVSGMERQNPEALLEVEKENLREQIAKFNQGLATHAGLCERLAGKIRKLETDEQDLRAKATANLRAGNRELAGQYALRLQEITTDLTESRQQLEQAEQSYKELVAARDTAVRTAREKIDSLKRNIDELKVQRAQAELSEMAAGMVTEIDGAGDTLNRLDEIVEEERMKAAGRARVARDSIDTTDLKMKEAETRALADQALADFAAREGIPLEASSDASATPPQANRSMGPATETAAQDS